MVTKRRFIVVLVADVIMFFIVICISRYDVSHIFYSASHWTMPNELSGHDRPHHTPTHALFTPCVDDYKIYDFNNEKPVNFVLADKIKGHTALSVCISKKIEDKDLKMLNQPILNLLVETFHKKSANDIIDIDRKNINESASDAKAPHINKIVRLRQELMNEFNNKFSSPQIRDVYLPGFIIEVN